MLPNEFKDRMKLLLKDKYDEFINTYNNPNVKSIRVNTNKISVEAFLEINPFKLTPIPYTKDGFYVEESSLGNHPYHHAGLFYVQDPAAMMPVNCLEIQPNWLVLDLCAAPGGKSIQIASKLTDGILVSNEINYNRAKILFSNIERMGLTNTVILNNDSYSLSKKFINKFDAIFIDAPCSGEGMFRKDPNAIKEWSLKKVDECASKQKELLKHADIMLKDGGFLVYSTCTYSLEENELMISNFLKEYDYEVMELPKIIKDNTAPGYVDETIDKRLINSARFYPHIAPGEGQFVCVLKKKGVLVNNTFEFKTNDLINKYANDIELKVNAYQYQNKFYHKLPIDLDNLKIVSGGVQLGELVNNRFIYHHNIVTAYGNNFKNKLNLTLEDPRLNKYLHGEEISDPTVANGYGVILVNNYPLGLFKASNGTLKNHYPKGLRTVK